MNPIFIFIHFIFGGIYLWLITSLGTSYDRMGIINSYRYGDLSERLAGAIARPGVESSIQTSVIGLAIVFALHMIFTVLTSNISNQEGITDAVVDDDPDYAPMNGDDALEAITGNPAIDGMMRFILVFALILAVGLGIVFSR